MLLKADREQRTRINLNHYMKSPELGTETLVCNREDERERSSSCNFSPVQVNKMKIHVLLSSPNLSSCDYKDL